MANPSVSRAGLAFTIIFPRGAYRFQGGHRVYREPPRLTYGRQSVVVSHSGGHEYRLETRSHDFITTLDTDGGVAQAEALFRERWFDWWSWAQQGNLFAFALDDDRRHVTNLAAPAGPGPDMTIDVVDASGFSVGDSIRFIDPNDTRRHDVHKIVAINVNELTLERAPNDSWDTTTIVTDRFYFPSCLLTSDGPADQFRRGGNGVWLSDIVMDFVEAT